MAFDLRRGIIDAASALGISPVDLATAISYETGGSFDAGQRGPTTKWGQHRGYIQFGEPQARQYGVDWSNPEQSQLGADGAVVKYLRDTGVRPGMGLLDVYSAINAGGVGRYNRSDAANGGAPGTVADKVNNQMAGHRQKAMALLGDMSAGAGNYGSLPDGPKGQEVYAPAPSQPVMTASSEAIPASVQAAAKPTPSGGISDILGMMAMAQSQGPQFSPVQIMGPSGDQANGLLKLVQALKGNAA